VRASDQGSPQRRSTVRVSVHVVGPGGDGRPSTLSAPNPHFTRVTELDPEGYLVAVVQPPVLDGTIIWFSIVAGDPREEFIIGVDSGSVQLARQLDCETQNLYNLTISLSDSHRTVYTHYTEPSGSVRPAHAHELPFPFQCIRKHLEQFRPEVMLSRPETTIVLSVACGCGSDLYLLESWEGLSYLWESGLCRLPAKRFLAK
ncbi:protocadherin Fat 2-like, partial [Homalodisca vitripennis]|uniref:protocadherin Fat 2-like n=1 Tax=Homalodisca vitripennis TaxID=197043 RepID=UPI001EEB92A6